MSKLEELIQLHCPDGVEYVKIGQIAQVGTGSSNGNEADDEGMYPFFVRSQSIKRKNDYEYDEEAIIIPGEGGIGEIFHYINGKYALHQRVYRIHFFVQSVNVKFAYYYMRSFFKQFIMKKAVSATVVSIRKPMIKDFVIPVPPLPVQEEIVRILDTFAELQAALQAELQKRLQQYNYYRDNLLSFEGRTDVEWKKLGEVCDFRNGFAFKSNLFTEDGSPIIRITNITGNNVDMSDLKFFHMEDYPKSDLSQFAIKNGDILVAMSGATTGKIGIYKGDVVAYLNQRTGKFEPKGCLDNRFLYYFLQTQVSNMYKMAGGGAQPNLSSNDLKSKITIPVPPLSVQKQIADILDRFDTLTTDITAGLPAEIEARRKQYEYYRDQLLTFKQKAS